MYHFSIALDENNSCTHGIANWELTDGYFGAYLHQMTPGQVEDARDMLIRKLARVVLYTVAVPVADYAAYGSPMLSFARSLLRLGSTKATAAPVS